MNETLNQLREIAGQATPGPWAVYDRGIGYEVQVNGHELNHCSRETFDKWDATHIATFDPPTVLALIERVQAAEAAVQRVREVCESSAFDCTTRDWGDLEAVTTDDVLTALDGGGQE